MDINISHASKILGVTRPTIYAMQRRNELPEKVTAISIMLYIQGKEDALIKIKSRLGEYLKEDLAVAA